MCSIKEIYMFCLSVREDIFETTSAIFTNFSEHDAHGCGSVLYRQGDEIPTEGAVFGVFFPTNNALYSISFGTHTKTTEPIEMPFGMMTRIGRRYHMLDG